MFKKLAFIICGLVYTTVAAAQEGKLLPLQAQCATIPEMMQTLDRYKETPLFIGQGMTFGFGSGQPYRGGMLFYVNQDTGSWSILQVFGDDVACLIFNGGDFMPWYEN